MHKETTVNVISSFEVIILKTIEMAIENKQREDEKRIKSRAFIQGYVGGAHGQREMNAEVNFLYTVSQNVYGFNASKNITVFIKTVWKWCGSY